jgi:hypothetical protein
MSFTQIYLMVALQLLYQHFKQSEIGSEPDSTKATAEANREQRAEFRSLMVDCNTEPQFDNGEEKGLR